MQARPGDVMARAEDTFRFPRLGVVPSAPITLGIPFGKGTRIPLSTDYEYSIDYLVSFEGGEAEPYRFISFDRYSMLAIRPDGTPCGEHLHWFGKQAPVPFSIDRTFYWSNPVSFRNKDGWAGTWSHDARRLTGARDGRSRMVVFEGATGGVIAFSLKVARNDQVIPVDARRVDLNARSIMLGPFEIALDGIRDGVLNYRVVRDIGTP